MIFFTPKTKIYSRFDSNTVLHKIPGRNLFCADLIGLDLRDADLSGANLGSASFQDADLRGAGLQRANLECADLRVTSMADADLRDANLAYANLEGVNLTRVRLDGAHLGSANLAGAEYNGVTIGKRGEVKFASRSDGYTFRLMDCSDGEWRVMAGCRWFTMPDDYNHWSTSRGGTRLGAETLDILDFFNRHTLRLDKERDQ